MAEQLPLSDDCLALWRFDEANATDNAADATGNGHTATRNGAPAVAAGQWGNARGPYSAATYFTVSDDATLQPEVATVCAWVNYTGSNPEPFAKIITRDNATSQSVLGLLTTADRGTNAPGFELAFEGGSVGLIRCPYVLENGWHLIGGTWNGDSYSMYVDGVHVQTRYPGAQTLKWSAVGDWRIGAEPSFAAQHSPAITIDEMAIYDTAKTEGWFAQVWDAWQQTTFTAETRGAWNLFLKIDGLEPILWQYTQLGEPTDWTRSIKTCLRSGQEVSADLDLATMESGLSAMTFEVEDVINSDGTSFFGQLFAPGRFSTTPYALLKEGTAPHQYVAADATTIPVNGNGNNITTGENHIGQETISVGAVSADNLTSVTRGLYPCIGDKFGRTYHRPSEEQGGYLASISPYPYSWIGRRVALYATQWLHKQAQWGDEAYAALIWTGRIADRIIQRGSDRTWQLSCTSIIEDLKHKQIGTSLATDTLAPYISLMGTFGRQFQLGFRTNDGIDLQFHRRTVTVPAGLYDSPGSLVGVVCQSINTAIRDIPANDPLGPGYSEGLHAVPDVSSGTATIVFSSSFDSDIEVYINPRGPRLTSPMEPCHALLALGVVERREWKFFTVPGGSAGDDNGYRLEGTPYTAYQPLHSACRGTKIYPLAPSKFWADQGDAGSAHGAVCIPDAVFDPDTDSEGNYYFSYSSVDSTGLTFDDDLAVDYSVDSVSLGAFVGQKEGDDPAELKQVYIPRYWDTDGTIRNPFTMLLYPLLSTGGQNGYNHATYDKLPLGLSMGVQVDMVNVASFENADLSIRGSQVATRYPYVIDEPITWMDLANRECRLFGYAVVLRDGKINLRNVLEPAFDRFVTVIDESSGTMPSEFPDSDMSLSTVVNRYEMKIGYNIATRKYKYVFTIDDAISINGLETVKSVDIEHPGVFIPNDIDARDILEPFFTDRWLGSPNPVVNVSLNHTMINSVFVGDVVAFVSSRVSDPLGLGIYNTSVYATVVSVRWDYGRSIYTGSATLILHPYTRYLSGTDGYPSNIVTLTRGAAWAPSAAIDRSYNGGSFTNGYDSSTNQLYLLTSQFSDTTDQEDGERLAGGAYIRVIEAAPADPDSPQVWGPIEVSSDYATDGSQVLTLASALAGYDGDKEYIVEYADYPDSASEQLNSTTYMADSTTMTLSSTTVAGRYA